MLFSPGSKIVICRQRVVSGIKQIFRIIEHDSFPHPRLGV